MASSPQKSPSSLKSPPEKSPSSRKKDDSFLGKLGGTSARRKKAKEVSERQEEGMNAINLPLSSTPFELDPEDTVLDEIEVRTMVDPYSRNDPKLQELMKVLIDWISDVLVRERIIVKDLVEDLYDGQVLQKLFENLEGEKLNVAEVTQCEITQKQKLQTVLEKINDTLKISSRNTKWNTVHCQPSLPFTKVHFYFLMPIVVSGLIKEIMSYFTDLFFFQTLITFVNKHLNKLNLEVSELETQFADGMYLVLLMGLLEGYFAMVNNLKIITFSRKQKLLPTLLMYYIVNCDLKSTLRVLYNLFTKYRNVE
uniref:Parvin, alpha b n=1 Tax=Cyprinus carpio TaxID=7962 RepID=A0A8C2GLU9_CYPCA